MNKRECKKKIKASAFPIYRKLLGKDYRLGDFCAGVGSLAFSKKKSDVEAKVFVMPWTLFIFTSSSIFEKNNDIPFHL
jgi:hypothetical protein